MFMHAIMVKCNTDFHYRFIHSPMNACSHDGIQVVSNLSVPQIMSSQFSARQNLVHSTEYGHFMATLAMVTLISGWEMVVLQP